MADSPRRPGGDYGRDPFAPDDSATRYIPRDAGNGGRHAHPGGAAIPPRGNEGQDTAWSNYDPDADFRGDDSLTRYGSGVAPESPQTRAADYGGGQYWAPLSEDERNLDYGESAYAQSSGYGQGQQAQFGGPGQYSSDDVVGEGAAPAAGNGGNNSGRQMVIVALAAIVAVVVVVVLVLLLGRSGDSAEQPTVTTTVEQTPTTTQTVPESTSSIELPPEVNDALNQGGDRLRQELDRLQENPPALPGLNNNAVTEVLIPTEVVGKSPAAVEIELRVGGFRNITVIDAQGNETTSARAMLSSVTGISPSEGSAVTPDTPVSIYVE